MAAHTRVQASPTDSLDFLIRSFQVSRMIRLVADLAVADKITPGGHVKISELAATCSVLPGPLIRILRALAAFGIFSVNADGIVSHSLTSLRLRSDAPQSLRDAARFFGAPGSWKAWGELDAALSGDVPHLVAWNASRFDYLRDHPAEARLYDAFMAGFPVNRHSAVAAAYDFSNAKLVADIGGGNGSGLSKILVRHPTPRGIVFDRADVVEAIPDSTRLDGRIEVQGGSFFDRVPSEADVYLLVTVLHDWSDDDCARILRVVRNCMPSDARLLIVEQILEPDPAIGNPMLYLVDIQMMAMFGTGRERTEAEFAEILSACGFRMLRLISTRSPYSIVEAAPS